jgi:GNAT superfamily N-acetyltransferase
VTLVTRTWLELREPSLLRRHHAPPPAGATIHRHHPPDVSAYRAWYHAVGHDWHWRDRTSLDDDALAAQLARATVLELRVDGDFAGYAELLPDDQGGVELRYFGLAAGFMGRGLGGWLLTTAVDVAWAMGAARVWLNTCTLDSPAALPNYRARGFTEFHRDQYEIA